MKIPQLPTKKLRAKGAHIVTAALLLCAFSPLAHAVFAQADNPQGSGSSNVFRFLIAVVCFFAPYCLVFKIIQFIGGIPHALTSALRGRTEGVMAKVRGFAGEARKTTSPSLDMATFMSGRREISTEKSLDKLGRRRGLMGRVPLKSNREAYARAGQMRARYTADADAKRISDLDMFQLQALADARGDTAVAARKLDDQGFEGANYSVAGLEQAKQRFSQLGGDFGHMTASMYEAIGNTASERGDMFMPFMESFKHGEQRRDKSGASLYYDQSGNLTTTPTDQKAYEPGLYEQAGGNPVDAGGMSARWGIVARSKGQFSMDPEAIAKVGDLGSISGSDYKRSMQKLAGYIKEGVDTGAIDKATGQVVAGAKNAEKMQGILDAVVRTGARGGLSGVKLEGFNELFTPGTRSALPPQVVTAVQGRIREEKEHVRISA